jgi:hypothetical protein
MNAFKVGDRVAWKRRSMSREERRELKPVALVTRTYWRPVCRREFGGRMPDAWRGLGPAPEFNIMAGETNVR